MKHPKRIYVLLAILVMAIVAITVRVISKSPNLRITDVKEVGLVENPTRPELIRDGGVGAIVGGKYLWTFGDTLFSPKSVDGTNGRTMTAGYAELSKPLEVNEPLDANRAPSQFVPLASADMTYNDSIKKGDDRYAVWPGMILPRPERKDALVYYLRLKVNPGGNGLNYDLLNTGIARVAEGSTKADVIVENLFSKPETLYRGPGFVKDDFVYFYSCSNASNAQCSLARVATKDALEKSRYTFWDGKKWQSDMKKAIQKYPGSSAGTSIGYVSSFKKYIVFYNQPFSKDMYYSTSKDVTGPWSQPQKFYTATANNYALSFHPELTDKNGNLLLTYYMPKSGMHAIRVTVQ